MKAVFTIEQVEDKVIVTVEAAEVIFNKKQEVTPMKAEDIAEWIYKNTGTSIMYKKTIAKYINDLIEYEVNKAKK